MYADKFRLLHLSVAVAFAEQLQKDMGAWEEGRTEDVSLAAKWAPTPKGSLILLPNISNITNLLGFKFVSKSHMMLVVLQVLVLKYRVRTIF